MSSTAAPRTALGSLGGRLQHARQRGFVGRTGELAVFRRSLATTEGAPRVLLVHGLGGLGKSTLLNQMAHEAAEAGRAVARVDAAQVRVPEHLAATAPSGAVPAVVPAGTALESARASLAHAMEADPSAHPVLVVDSLEQCPGLEPLLRHELLPALPEEAVVVLAGRQTPQQEWTADPGWRELVEVLHLPPLGPDEATELLHQRGVPASDHPALLRFSVGNPLALSLAADATGGRDAAWAPDPDLTQALLGRLIDPEDQREHALSVAVCALSGHTTVALLRATMGVDAATAEFTWLSSLPCVQTAVRGLQFDELARRLFDASARWSDPVGYAELRRQLWSHQTERVVSGGAEAQDAVGELVHLSRQARETPDSLGRGPQAVELDVGADLRPAVLELAETSLGPECLPVVEYWLDRQPEAFSVYGYPQDGVPTAFLAWLRLTERDERDVAADPVVAAVWQHAERRRPWHPGDEIAVARFLGSTDPSPGLHVSDPRILHWHSRIVRSARRLVTSYVAVPDREAWSPCLAGLDHRPCPTTGPGDEDDEEFGAAPGWALFEHDWRQVPLSAYLDRVFPAAHEAHETHGAPGEHVEARAAVPSREAFDEALRQMLRQWHDDDEVAANLLTRAGLGRGHEDGGDRVGDVRQAVTRAIQDLQDDPRHVKYARALAATYVNSTATQEAAAVRLGVPFGTFRRHLARGTTLLADRLWTQFDHPAAPAHPLGATTDSALVTTASTTAANLGSPPTTTSTGRDRGARTTP